MKYLIAALFALALLPSFAQSDMEAKSFSALRQQVEAGQFRYVETGKMFGFDTTHSCMFKAPGLTVFRNYCYPVRNYPAQGYTIVSAEFGIVELYEENMGHILKRDVHISEFPAILAPYLAGTSPDMTLQDYSSIIEKMYYKFYPGCWSTNHSYYTEGADANCSKPTENVVGFAHWAQETQSLLNDAAEWKALMLELDQKFKRR